jgi:phosphonate transport system substrate-binding protein
MMHAAHNREPQLDISARLNWKRTRRQIFIAALVALTATFSPAMQAAEEPLVLGVFPRRNAAETTKLFAPMAAHLGERLGREIKLVASKNFDSFWKDVTEQRYDIVHYNQYHYIRSAKTYKVIAHTQEFGKSAVAGTLFVRKDSGITSVTQLRGRTVIFGGGKDAMLSYIAPRYLLLQAGLKEGDFKAVIAAIPHNALVALYYKQADAAGNGEFVVDQPLIKNAINTEELKVLASTEPLLFLPWAVKRAMPVKLAHSIQSTLLDLKNSDAGKQVLKSAVMTGIGIAGDKDYDPHRKMATAVLGPEGIAK